MRHPRLIEWEDRLKKLFDEVDDFIEDKYGNFFSLHPNRPAKGATSNREHDGLFNIGASFTPGFGSEIGRGYVVDVDMITLDNVPENTEEEILNDVVYQVRKRLPSFFPERRLEISKDGNVFKIHGDFSLGESSEKY